MKKTLGMLLFLVFLLGWATSNLYTEAYAENYEINFDATEGFQTFIVAKERLSPQDRVKEDQIHVYDDSVVIRIDNPEWSTFTDTNSMDPIIDKGANAIHIVPASEEEIQLGDIVAYESSHRGGTIIHRVVETGFDESGKYFIMKGDNNLEPDPGKVRFAQIKRVLVAVIY